MQAFSSLKIAMSRGLGRLQAVVLKQIYDEPVSRGQLLWAVSEKENRVAVTGPPICKCIQRGEIETSFQKQFSRTLKGLIDQGVVESRNRKFENYQQFLRYYPYKTSTLEVRQLRAELLPHLDVSKRHFNLRDNEDFLGQGFGKKTRSRLRKEWLSIEAELCSELATNKDSRSILLRIISRGSELFVKERDISCSHSLSNLLRELESCGSTIHLPTKKRLRDLLGLAFPEAKVAHLSFKSQLYSIGRFSDQGRSWLKDDAKNLLWKKCPEIVEALPGHKNSEKPFWGADVSYSPLLDKLIDRWAFGSFEFLERKQ